MNREDRTAALLLLGPTGAGKTPLGDAIQANGLWGRPCAHFDFGANLRRLVERDRPDDAVGREDLDLLRRVLETGALLEDGQFPIAERVLRRFLAERAADPSTLVVLNGLPRHVGQAEAIDRIVRVEAVVWLVCPAEVVIRRIRGNAGGDRAGRTDDGLSAVREKLATFTRRTAPLVEHYRALGTPVEPVPVAAATTSDDLWALLNRWHALPGRCMLTDDTIPRPETMP
jgi:adenylate kinase family enzyme